MKIKPNFEIMPFGDKGPVVIGFGRNGGATNWKTLIDPKIKRGAKTKPAMIEAIKKAVGAVDICAPNTSVFNAVVARPEEFHSKISLEGLTFKRGVEAEGVVLPKGKAAAFFPADCYTVVAFGAKGTVVAAHAGGKSTFDHLAVMSGQTAVREHWSIADAMVGTLKSAGEEVSETKVFICFGIFWEDFGYPLDDPRTSGANAKILGSLQEIGKDVVLVNPATNLRDRYSIKRALFCQFQKLGIKARNIDCSGIYTSDNDDNGQPLFWSHEQAKVSGKQDEALNCRNLVLVINP